MGACKAANGIKRHWSQLAIHKMSAPDFYCVNSLSNQPDLQEHKFTMAVTAWQHKVNTMSSRHNIYCRSQITFQIAHKLIAHGAHGSLINPLTIRDLFIYFFRQD